jgi:MFS family permease
VWTIAVVALAAGFGQFGAVAALGDVAKTFGGPHSATLAEQAGLSGTKLGIGLAILRLASLGGLPLAALADRLGRRRMLIATCVVGLACTIATALSPSYWWFIAIFALGRPFLSATNALSQVSAAEQTSSANRAAAVALIAAGYGVGSGLTAIIHSLASSAIGFRGLFALAAVPLVVVVVMRGSLVEPDRFLVEPEEVVARASLLGALRRPYRRRLAVIGGLLFSVSFVSGPANSFLFLYAENIAHLRGSETAAMVVAAGGTGLVGLLVGRWCADRVGRRVTGACAYLAVALFGVLAYSGSRPALVIGYVLGVLGASAIAPAIGSVVMEMLPTEVRGSASGWEVIAAVLGATAGLLVFGAIAGGAARYATAAEWTFLLALPAGGLWFVLPETRGREPEQMWPLPGLTSP